MSMETFAPLMFAGLIFVLMIGFPVAFSLSALGLGCGFFAVYMGWFPASFMTALPLNVFGILSNDLLLAIPFFTLMGTMLEKCGLAEDMLDSMGQLFGPVRGGLGYSVIIVGFILGAITGTVAGQVIAMAMISLPVMMRWGYNMRYATGVLAASGTITQLVPPSLVLIEALLGAGAEVVAHDPVAMHETERRIGKSITYADSSYAALDAAVCNTADSF